MNEGRGQQGRGDKVPKGLVRCCKLCTGTTFLSPPSLGGDEVGHRHEGSEASPGYLLHHFLGQVSAAAEEPNGAAICAHRMPPLPVSSPHPPLPPPPTPLTSHPKLYVQPSRGAMALVRPQCGPHLSTKKQSEAASPGTESCTVSTRRYRLAGGWGGSDAAPAAPAAAPLGPPAEEDDTCRPRLCCRGALRERLSARLIGSAGPSSPAPAAIPT